MANAGAIGVLVQPSTVGVILPVWASLNISTYPVAPTPSQLGVITTPLPVWDLRGSTTNITTVPINGKIEGYIYASVGTPAPYVFVRLYVQETGGLIYQQQTDVTGYYKFINLNPGEAYTVVACSNLDPAQGPVMAMAQVQAVLA